MQTAVNLNDYGSSGTSGFNWASLATQLAGSASANNSSSGYASGLDTILDPIGAMVKNYKTQEAEKVAAEEQARRNRFLDLAEKEQMRNEAWWRGLRNAMRGASISRIPAQPTVTATNLTNATGATV